MLCLSRFKRLGWAEHIVRVDRHTDQVDVIQHADLVHRLGRQQQPCHLAVSQQATALADLRTYCTDAFAVERIAATQVVVEE